MRIENVLSDMEADIASAEAEEALNHKLALHVREHLTERDGSVADDDVAVEAAVLRQVRGAPQTTAKNLRDHIVGADSAPDQQVWGGW